MPGLLEKLADVSRVENRTRRPTALHNPLADARQLAGDLFRQIGATWDSVGDALGIAKQNARVKYSKGE